MCLHLQYSYRLIIGSVLALPVGRLRRATNSPHRAKPKGYRFVSHPGALSKSPAFLVGLRPPLSSH
jgi:hypothetical protein